MTTTSAAPVPDVDWRTVAALVDPDHLAEAESRRADAEEARADGAEIHARSLLMRFVVAPAGLGDLDGQTAFELCEELIGDMGRGVGVDELDPVARLADLKARPAVSGEISARDGGRR